MKDKSNERIVKVVKEISRIMEREGRGFIFCPIVQPQGNHKTLCAVSFNTEDGEIGEVELVQFWASLTSLIDNFMKSLPKDKQREFKNGFIPFIQATAEISFPTIKLAKLR